MSQDIVNTDRLAPEILGDAWNRVSMHPEFVSAIVRVAQGEEVNVAEFCRTHHISPTTFYKYVARFVAECPDLQKWLRKQPAPDTLDELQALLDQYREVYGNRRHQSLAGRTPQQRYDDTPTVAATPEHKTRYGQVTRSVSHTGIVQFDGHSISLGRRWGDQKAIVHWRGDDVTVMVGDVIAGELTLD
jgi:hypothetical protein